MVKSSFQSKRSSSSAKLKDKNLKKKKKVVSKDSNSLFSTSVLDNSFQSWLINSGVYGLDSLEIKSSSNCKSSLGVFAKKDFNKNDLFFKVPLKNILGFSTVYQSDFIKSFILDLKKHLDSSYYQKLSLEKLIWIYMIHDSTTNGFFSPYFSSLSKKSPLILSWCDEENDSESYLNIIKDTNLYTSLMSLKDSLVEVQDLFLELNKHSTDENKFNSIYSLDKFNLDNFLWASGHYLSRRYPSKYSGGNDNEKQKSLFFQNLNDQDSSVISSFQREEQYGELGALVPLLDIINHNSDKEWLKFEVNDDFLHIICNEPIKKGEELFSNYGDLSNERLLFAYGFSLEKNLFDEYLIKLKVPEKLRENPNETTKVFGIKQGGFAGIPKDLIKLLSAMNKLMEPGNDGDESGAFEILMNYLIDSIEKMSNAHVERRNALRKLGFDLQLYFPDSDEDFTSDSFEGFAYLKLLPDYKKPRDVRARMLSWYLLSQYSIIMNAAKDINAFFSPEGDEDEEEGENGEEDDEEAEEAEDDEAEDDEDEDDEDD